MINRRVLVAGALSGFASPVLARLPGAVSTLLGPSAELGWAALDLGSGRSWGRNANLRLPMCSTFKFPLTAYVLARVDAGSERLDRAIGFGPGDLVEYAPTVEAALRGAGGRRAKLSVAALCEAATVLSDNAAANLLLSTIGGPAGLTVWLRSIGDRVTRLDRSEPALNDVPRGDVRDTTTAEAMTGDIRSILYGKVLKPTSRARLFGWMLACRTAPDRLTAGLPAGWRIAHRTGTRTVDPGHAPGERAAAGDIGALLPPHGAPILIAAYIAGSERPQADIDRWFADLARSIAGHVPRGRDRLARPRVV